MTPSLAHWACSLLQVRLVMCASSFQMPACCCRGGTTVVRLWSKACNGKLQQGITASTLCLHTVECALAALQRHGQSRLVLQAARRGYNIKRMACIGCSVVALVIFMILVSKKWNTADSSPIDSNGVPLVGQLCPLLTAAKSSHAIAVFLAVLPLLIDTAAAAAAAARLHVAPDDSCPCCAPTTSWTRWSIVNID
jgi:hypothetical protein